MSIRFTVNGVERDFAGDGGMPLLWCLRDHARLTGTKFGCGEMGIPSAAPALANAIFAATGVRIRNLPVLDQLAQALKKS